MFPNSFRVENADEHRKEFKRQQDRLKMMIPDPERKAVSADDMIFNLLQKSDTFKKATSGPPDWLRADSPSSCPFYQSIWSFTACSENMVDTSRISQILLTSGLHPDALGFIWNLANKTIPGQLTKQELYNVLALVGLAQSGRPFNNISVLQQLTTAPIPRLQANIPFRSPIPPTLNSPSAHTFPTQSSHGFQSQSGNPPVHSSVDNPSVPKNTPSLHLPSSHVFQTQSSHGFQTQSANPPVNRFEDNPSVPKNSLSSQSFQTQSGHSPASQSVPKNSPLSHTFQTQSSHGFQTQSGISPINCPVDNPSPSVPKNSPLSNAQRPSSLIKDDDDDDFQDFQSSNTQGVSNKHIPSPTSQYLNSQSPGLPSASLIPQRDVLLNPGGTTSAINTTDFLNATINQIEEPSQSTLKQDQQGPMILDSTPNYKSEDFFDDFTDFQNFKANPCTTEVTQHAPSVPKLSSFIKVSPESERKLRNLSQNESLATLPESKISSNNQVSSMPSIAVLGSSRSAAGRLANHSLGHKSEKPRHQRHYKIKPIVAAGTSPLPEDLFQKCLTKPPTTFLLKETKIVGAEDEDVAAMHSEMTRKIEIPSVGTFRETTFPSEVKPPESEPQDFFTNDDDKYRALRDLTLGSEETTQDTNEDFGEFLSADLPSGKAAEAWSVWNSSVNAPDDNLDWHGGVNASEGNSSLSIACVNNKETNQFSDVKEPQGSNSIQTDLFDLSFSSLALNTESQKIETEVKFGTNATARKDENDDFGDFVSPEITDFSTINLAPTEDQISVKSVEGVLTRFGSLSSLELQSDHPVLTLDSKVVVDSDSVVIRCQACCHRLVKEAADTFLSISDRVVLEEVFTTAAARNYIKYLNIVYYISKRISISGCGSDAIHEEIENSWTHLARLATEFSIPLAQLDSEKKSGLPCAVCKGATSSSDIEEKGARFHVTCANLWINCIDSALPCF